MNGVGVVRDMPLFELWMIRSRPMLLKVLSSICTPEADWNIDMTGPGSVNTIAGSKGRLR
jgi:hypothetical protein